MFLLRGSDHYTDQSPPSQPGAHAKGGHKPKPTGGGGEEEDDEGQDMFGLGGGWLMSGRWLSVLRKEAVTGVGLGGHFAVCGTAAGEAYTWGLNPHGELGCSAPLGMEAAQAPTGLALLPPGEEVAAVAAGAYHAVAATQSGRVFGWGCNGANELAQVNSFTGDLRDCFYGAPVCADAVGQHPIPRLVGHKRHVVLVA